MNIGSFQLLLEGKDFLNSNVQISSAESLKVESVYIAELHHMDGNWVVGATVQPA